MLHMYLYTKKRKKLNDHRGATAALHAAWFQLPSSKHAWHRNTLQCAQPHLDLYTFLLLDASLYPALHADFVKGILSVPATVQYSVSEWKKIVQRCLVRLFWN